MTQHQAHQRRLGQYPAFQSFLDFLGSTPEDQHPQAWEQMYSLLLKEDDRPESDDWAWDRNGVEPMNTHAHIATAYERKAAAEGRLEAIVS